MTNIDQTGMRWIKMSFWSKRLTDWEIPIDPSHRPWKHSVWVRLLSFISRPLVTELCVCYGQIYWAPCDRLSLDWLMILLSHIRPIKCPLCLWSVHEWAPVTVQPQRPEKQTQVTYLQEEECVVVCVFVCVLVFTHVHCTWSHWS